MKKTLITIICVMILIPLLCACSKTTENTENEQVTEEKSIVDTKSIIFESENLGDALAQFEGLYEEAETTEEKEELKSYINEYFLNDLNSCFYFENPENAVMHIESDSRAIYVKSKDEVYIVPYSEKELTDMNLQLEDIPQIENSEIYKYHVAEITSPQNGTDAIGEYIKIGVTFKSDYINESDITPINSMRITVYFRNNNETIAYQFYGYFADEQDMVLDSDREMNRGAVRDYFRNVDTALSEKEKMDEMFEGATEKWKESKEKAEPAIGMTKDEVLSSSWGEPDKKNIDEYEWGTEEQWVYDKKGYIYFEDGIVTSISHR